MSQETEIDGVWADPEQILKPSREEILVQLLEEFSEERYFACWTDEALCSSFRAAPRQASDLRELLMAAQTEVNQYMSRLDGVMQLACSELEEARYGYDPRLIENPRIDLRNLVSTEIQNRMEDDSSTLAAITPLEREWLTHQYTAERIQSFWHRFTCFPKEELTSYPTAKLRDILQKAQSELFRRVDALETLCMEKAAALLGMSVESSKEETTDADRELAHSPLYSVLRPNRKTRMEIPIRPPLRPRAS